MRLVFLVLTALAAAHGQDAEADLVLVVDTSTSMAGPQMDPTHRSLLVARLFNDIVPGRLAVVRLLDLIDDKALISTIETNRTMECHERKGETCKVVDFAPGALDDIERLARGALVRQQRASPDFRRELESHLVPKANNSLFGLAFLAARGVFAQHGPPDPNIRRTVIWLSDGSVESEGQAMGGLSRLKGDGVIVEPLIFGRDGETAFVTKAGLTPIRVESAQDLMAAFADGFRRAIGAPYRVDGTVAARPDFEMKRGIQEAWIVVYGDASLNAASVSGPAGSQPATYASDSYGAAGAYRVAYLRTPSAGKYRISATAGGPQVAYAVVQRSNLRPFLVSPRVAAAGAATRIVAGLHNGDRVPLAAADMPGVMRIDAEIDGRSVPMTAEADGNFSGLITFNSTGRVKVRLHAVGDVVDRVAEETIDVNGFYRYTGGPLHIDFGSFRFGENACREAPISADQQGTIPLVLEMRQRLPVGYSLELRSAAGTHRPGESSLQFAPTDRLQLCLVAGPRVASSESSDALWGTIQPAGQPSQAAQLYLAWHVLGLSWLQRWWRVLAIVVGLLLLGLIILGIVLPHRWPRAIQIVYASSLEDLDEAVPQEIKPIPGTGVGFYRNARAYLHPDFRVSSREKGAAVKIEAIRRGVLVSGVHGSKVCRDLGNEWAPLPAAGWRGRLGEPLRVDGAELFFRLQSGRKSG
jgi:hypothetical protein